MCSVVVVISLSSWPLYQLVDPATEGGEEEEWSVSVVVENALGNSSEVVVVLQGEVEWWGALLCSVCISRSPHVTVT